MLIKTTLKLGAAALAAALFFAPPARGAGVDWDVSSASPLRFDVAFDGSSSNANIEACAAGDLNGDGNPDLVLVEPTGDSLGRADNGVVYVAFGPLSAYGALKPIESNYSIRVEGAAAGDNLQKCWAWDLNNDGQEDLIVRPNAGTNAGVLYVLYGPLSGSATSYDLADSARFSMKVTPANSSVGILAPFMADLNGDGVDDMLIQAPLADNGGTDTGSLFVIYGPFPNGTGQVKDLGQSSAYNLRIDGPNASAVLTGGANGGSYTNNQVVAVGDLNGDGTQDLAINAMFADTLGRTDNGAVWVSTGPWPAGTGNAFTISSAGRSMVRFDGPQANQFMTRSVIGDLNGDGANDLCMAGPYNDPLGRSDAGQVYCVLGPLGYPIGTTRDLAGPTTNYNTVFQGQAASHNIGYNSLAAVDLNADGVKDLAIETQFWDGTATDEGAIYVVYGGASWPAGTGNARDLNSSGNYNLRINDGAVSLGLGETNSLFTDMDGDGVTDIVVGGRNNTSDSCSSGLRGRTAVFFGPMPAGTGNVKLVENDYDQRYHFSTCAGFTYPYHVAADFDRDGVKDLALTYYFFDSGSRQNNGRVFVVSASTAGPRIYAPSLFTSATNPNVLWSGAPGATTYRFQLATDPLFAAPISDQNVLGTQASVSGLSNGASYYARVKAADGNYRRWSPIVNFTVDTTPLAAPVLLFPGNDSGTHPPITTQTPLFDWTDSSAE